MEEVWKDVIGYEGLYQVSNLGNVKSLDRYIYKKNGSVHRFQKGAMLKNVCGKDGYLTTGLTKDNTRKGYKVHQLVAMAFLGHKPCGHKIVVDHINDIKTDNRVENINLVTNRENAYKTQGRYTSKYKGVSWSIQNKKWISSICINGKKKHLGSFNCELAASLAYQNKLKEII
jgi:hypothetical protein